MALRLMILAGWQVPHPGLDPIRWHAHEMLFRLWRCGGGRLLVDGRSELDGLAHPEGRPAGSFAGYLAAGTPRQLAGGEGALLDLLFLPALGLALAGPMVRANCES